jgi:hypothetical protein
MTSNRNTNRRSGPGAIVALAALLAAFLVPFPAVAGAANDCENVGSDPTAAQYCSPTDSGGGGDLGVTDSSDSSGGGGEVAGVSGGSLPFTGLDVAVLAAVAVALTSVGLALQRLSAPQNGRR